MSDEAPAAPAPAVPAEPTAPTTPEAAPATAPERTPAQSAATAPAESASYFTPEQLKEMENFYKNNGGFEKVFGATKNIISRPQDFQKPQPQQQPAQAPQAPQTPSGAATQSSAAPGTYSLEEMAALSYFDRLASTDKYANIADDIRSGEVLKGLKDFNIAPIKDGRINDAEVRKYLDLYAATKPAIPTSATPTADQQVEYVPIQEIKTREDADKIQLQSLQLRAQGLAPHPLEEKAREFIKSWYSKKK